MRYFLELCLESVLKATENIHSEIIVIDNNSTDDSCEMIKSRFPNVKLIKNEENYGFSKGNNIGVKEAKGEYICILNPDTIMPEDCFKKLLQFSEAQNDAGIVGCKLVDGKGRFLPESKRNIPFPIVAMKKMLGNDSDYYANQLAPDEVGEVPVLVGAFMLIKGEVYQEVGGFDEDYFMYGEDVDLSYKVWKAGYKNFYFGKTSVIHFKGESTFKNLEYAKRFYGAMQIFYKKHLRKNRLFDFIVFLGIRLAPIIKSTPSLSTPEYDKIVVFSKSHNFELKDYKSSSVTYHSELEYEFADSSLVIYDISCYSFKDILNTMERNSSYSKVYFRFLSSSGNFFLGSDSAAERGEVTKL